MLRGGPSSSSRNSTDITLLRFHLTLITCWPCSLQVSACYMWEQPRRRDDAWNSVQTLADLPGPQPAIPPDPDRPVVDLWPSLPPALVSRLRLQNARTGPRQQA